MFTRLWQMLRSNFFLYPDTGCANDAMKCKQGIMTIVCAYIRAAKCSPKQWMIPNNFQVAKLALEQETSRRVRAILNFLTFPCPPLHSFLPQEGYEEDCVCRRGRRSGWAKDTEWGSVAKQSVVSSVSVRSLLVCDRRGLRVAATTPTPCRNGS